MPINRRRSQRDHFVVRFVLYRDGGTTIPTTTLFFIGAGVLLFALVLRH